VAERLNLRQIEAFKAVVEAGTVNRAADVLCISQPAVSKLIAGLERAVGFALFDRVRGRLVATAEGMALYEEVYRTFLGIASIGRAAEAIRTQRQGHVAIGVMPALSTGFIQRVLARFLAGRPEVRVSIHARSSQFIVDGLANRQLDLGLVAGLPEHPLLRCEPLVRRDAVCIVPAGHRLAAAAAVRAEDLAGEPFVSLGEGSATRRRIDELFAGLGIERQLRVEASSAQTLAGLVAEGLGVSLIHPLFLEDRHGRVAAKPFRPAVPMELGLGMPHDGPKTGLAAALAAEIHRTAADPAPVT